MKQNNMVHSAEVRWMFHEKWNDEILKWFKNPEKSEFSADDEGPRFDKYLIFPASNTVGVKLRGGDKFEIKSLLSAPRPFEFAFGNGRTDQWVKWSFKSDELKPLETALLASGRWITLKKTRLLRKFSDDEESLVEVLPNPKDKKTLPINGCNVELTLIEIIEGAASQTWFSLGFEAFDSATQGALILDQTLAVFFKQFGAMPQKSLTGRDCFSYPAWLATLPEAAPKEV